MNQKLLHFLHVIYFIYHLCIRLFLVFMVQLMSSSAWSSPFSIESRIRVLLKITSELFSGRYLYVFLLYVGIGTHTYLYISIQFKCQFIRAVLSLIFVYKFSKFSNSICLLIADFYTLLSLQYQETKFHFTLYTFSIKNTYRYISIQLGSSKTL